MQEKEKTSISLVAVDEKDTVKKTRRNKPKRYMYSACLWLVYF